MLAEKIKINKKVILIIASSFLITVSIILLLIFCDMKKYNKSIENNKNYMNNEKLSKREIISDFKNREEKLQSLCTDMPNSCEKNTKSASSSKDLNYCDNTNEPKWKSSNFDSENNKTNIKYARNISGIYDKTFFHEPETSFSLTDCKHFEDSYIDDEIEEHLDMEETKLKDKYYYSEEENKQRNKMIPITFTDGILSKKNESSSKKKYINDEKMKKDLKPILSSFKFSEKVPHFAEPTKSYVNKITKIDTSNNSKQNTEFNTFYGERNNTDSGIKTLTSSSELELSTNIPSYLSSSSAFNDSRFLKSSSSDSMFKSDDSIGLSKSNIYYSTNVEVNNHILSKKTVESKINGIPMSVIKQRRRAELEKNKNGRDIIYS